MIDSDHDGTVFFPHLVYLPAHKRADANIRKLVKAARRGDSIAVKIITRIGTEMTVVVNHN